MGGEDWLNVVEAAVVRSGLPYQLVACQCKRHSPTCSATVVHYRTQNRRSIVVSTALINPEEARNEVIRQLRAYNVGFPVQCHNGHLSMIHFERDELEQRLADGRLTFYCEVCDSFREPTEAERAAVGVLLTDAVG